MSAQSPIGLPASAFLIAYDVEKQKLVGRGTHGILVRAAALVELSLGGQLVDHEGKAQPTGRRTDDPVLDAVLGQITASRPRTWKHWVNKGHKDTYQAVRERLAVQRVIRVQEAKLLGLIPKQNVTVADTRLIRELIAGARRAVLGSTAVGQVDLPEAALVSLVAAAELNTVFSGRERREHRVRIKQLAERTGPAVKALRKAVEDQHAIASGAAS
jgi:Golgi phosphoprotein 3 (GPP34)